MPVADVLLDAALDNDQAAIDMTNTGATVPEADWAAARIGLVELACGSAYYSKRGQVFFMRIWRHVMGLAPMPWRRVQHPLVLIGDEDKMTPPRAGLAVAEKLNNVQQRRLAGCGHSMLSEQPNQVLDELAAFLPF